MGKKNSTALSVTSVDQQLRVRRPLRGFLVFAFCFVLLQIVLKDEQRGWACPDGVIRSATLVDGYVTYPYIGDIWTTTWADNDKLYSAFGDGTGLSDCLPTLILDEPDVFDTGYTEVSPGCYRPETFENEYCEVFDCSPCLPLCVYTPTGLLELDGPVPNFNPCSGTQECRVGVNIPYGTLDAHIHSDKPSSLIFIEGRLYAHMHYPPGQPNYGYMAYSDDYGQSWEMVPDSPWGEGSHFEVVMFFQMGKAFDLNRDGYLYGLGAGDEALEPPVAQEVYLLRVPVGRYMQDGKEVDPVLIYPDYEYFSGFEPNGEVIWSGSLEEAVPLEGLQTLAQAAAMYHEGIGRYLFFSGYVGTAEGNEPGLEGLEPGYPLGGLYEAPHPWGPWRRAALFPGGFIAGLVPKGAGVSDFYFTAAGGGGLTYSLNVGHIQMEVCPSAEAAHSDQAEIFSSSTSVFMSTTRGATVSLGIHAVDRLLRPSLDGDVFVNELLTGASLLVQTSGEGVFAYSDDFDPHFRGRTQNIPPGESLEILNELPSEYPKPKILLDLYESDGPFAFGKDDPSLLWDGSLTYRFDLGQPITSFRLTTPDGRHATLINDEGWRDRGAVVIQASTDDVHWTELWRSTADYEGQKEVRSELPPALLGSSVLYLKLIGHEHSILDLYVSGTVDVSDLVTHLSLPEGISHKVYSDDLDSSHHAVIDWEGVFVEPISSVVDTIWPTSTPTVSETSSEIQILFPEEVGVTLGKSPDGGISGFDRVWIGSRRILSAPSFGLPSPQLEVLSASEVGGVTDWAAYLRDRDPTTFEWAKRGGRKVSRLDLAKAVYLGTSVEPGTATVRLRVQGTNADGILEWIIQPEGEYLAGTPFRGVSWRVRLDSGLSRAHNLVISEPVSIHYGDWTFAQIWGDFLEARLDFMSPFHFRRKYYFAEIQPYYLATGEDGTVVSFFDSPVAATATLTQDAARHWEMFSIPLGAGEVRESPKKYWLLNEEGSTDRWSALDCWTDLYDALSERWRNQLDISASEPVPRYGVLYPLSLRESYLRDGAPPLESSYFVELSKDLVPRLAEMNFAMILLDSPWESDALHPDSEYLEMSGSFGSWEAPWNLEIADAYGGESGLQQLVSKARENEIEVSLWSTSGHFSNSSPLLASRTDWLKWRIDGVPEAAGYGDITGVSLGTDYYDYHLGQLTSIRQHTGYEGLHFDSHLTFGVLEDGRELQPESELLRWLSMQKTLQDQGINNISVEGCSPIHLGQAGWGYEVYAWSEDPAERALAIQKFNSILGREYGLYRYYADLLPEPERYYRTLASKGVIEIWGDAIDGITDEEKPKIAQANKDYMQVLDRLERRHLIGCGETWYGVSWTKKDVTGEVVFSFQPFEYQVDSDATVTDITSNKVIDHHGLFTTETRHTYVIGRNTGTGPTPTPTPIPSLDPVGLLDLLDNIHLGSLSWEDLFTRSTRWYGGG